MDDETTLLILATAYRLLGDGQGGEWRENPEYTRAVVEMVHGTVGVPPGVVGHYGGDFRPFVLGMIYAANLVTYPHADRPRSRLAPPLAGVDPTHNVK